MHQVCLRSTFHPRYCLTFFQISSPLMYTHVYNLVCIYAGGYSNHCYCFCNSFHVKKFFWMISYHMEGFCPLWTRDTCLKPEFYLGLVLWVHEVRVFLNLWLFIFFPCFMMLIMNKCQIMWRILLLMKWIVFLFPSQCSLAWFGRNFSFLLSTSISFWLSSYLQF